MATYRFSALASGQHLSFRPASDVLRFDQADISAADVALGARGASLMVMLNTGPQAGKHLFLDNVSVLQLTTTNVSFANGSRIIIGDNTTGTSRDNLANTLAGGNGNDFLDGMGGNDTLDGGAGADTMYGGTENDTYIVDSSADVVIEYDGGGSHDLVRSSVSYTLPAWVNDLTLTGSTAYTGTGNGLDNIIVGTAGANDLRGEAGNDRLEGGAGNDRLVGGSGADTMIGGLHDDMFFVADPGDVVIELEGGGSRDRIGSTISYKLPAWVNELVLFSPNTQGTGNSLDNFLYGDWSGSHTLIGGAGNDTLDGGHGNDFLRGDAGADRFQFSAYLGSSNADVIADFVSRTDQLGLLHWPGLGARGTFGAGDARFRAGPNVSSAQDADDRVVYNTSTGALYYDPDGAGGQAADLFATLQGAPALAATDIVVI